MEVFIAMARAGKRIDIDGMLRKLFYLSMFSVAGYGQLLLIADGDSITAPGNLASQFWYPTLVAQELAQANTLKNFAFPGYTANSILDQMTMPPPMSDPSYPSGLLGTLNGWSAPKPKVFAMLIGTNDLYTHTEASGVVANTWENIQLICNDVRGAGAPSVVIFTILPRSDAGGVFSETARQSLNTLIRGGSSCPATVADIGNDPTIGQFGQSNDTTYYIDKVHLTAAGHKIIAGYMLAALDSLGFGTRGMRGVVSVRGKVTAR